LKLSKKICE